VSISIPEINFEVKSEDAKEESPSVERSFEQPDIENQRNEENPESPSWFVRMIKQIYQDIKSGISQQEDYEKLMRKYLSPKTIKDNDIKRLEYIRLMLLVVCVFANI